MPPIAPNTVVPAAGVALSPIELKAISVPQSLLFLLSTEYDLFLCITTVGIKKPFRLAIKTRLAPTYRLLIESGARRFGLSVTHTETESIITSDGVSTRMPLLRYVDYIPGGLHVDELLDCFGINTKALPRKAKPLEGTTTTTSSTAEWFEACFIDYSPYTSDEALHDVHGCGFYLTLDYGLSLATHSHLLQVTFNGSEASKKKGITSNKSDGAAYAASLANFLKFSGWEKLDLRYEDERHQSAVVILPTTQDANDLLERYENEESDNDVDDMADLTTATLAAFRPNFHVRPIAPTVSVPYIEDATLRKLRAQNWGRIEEFWRRCGVNKNTITVSNLYEGVGLEEVLKLFGGNVVAAAMTEDESPAKRRRVFVTFATSEDARDALSLDGKNTHGKSLKIHTAPPYVDATRRGKTIATKGLGLAALLGGSASPMTPSATAAPMPSPAGYEAATVKSPGLNVAAKEFVPKFAIGGTGFALPPPYTGGAPIGGSPTSAPPAYAAAPVAVPAATPPPAYTPTSGPAVPPAYTPTSGPAVPPAYSPSPNSSTAAVPPPYTPTGGVAAAVPPPAYGGAAAGTTTTTKTAEVSPLADGALPPAGLPAYSLPPPYGGKLPPPPHPFAAPPPAYTPSPGKTPESPISPAY